MPLTDSLAPGLANTLAAPLKRAADFPAGTIWAADAARDLSLVGGQTGAYADAFDPPRLVDLSSGLDVITNPDTVVAKRGRGADQFPLAAEAPFNQLGTGWSVDTENGRSLIHASSGFSRGAARYLDFFIEGATFEVDFDIDNQGNNNSGAGLTLSEGNDAANDLTTAWSATNPAEGNHKVQFVARSVTTRLEFNCASWAGKVTINAVRRVIPFDGWLGKIVPESLGTNLTGAVVTNTADVTEVPGGIAFVGVSSGAFGGFALADDVVDKIVEVTYTVSGLTAGSYSPSIRDEANGITQLPGVGSDGTYSERILVDGGAGSGSVTSALIFQASGGATTGNVTDVTLREVIPEQVVGPKARYVNSPGANGDLIQATVPVSGATSSVVMRTFVVANDWTPATLKELSGQWTGGSNGHVLRLGGGGVLYFYASTDGSDQPLAITNAGVSAVDGQGVWFQISVDVANSTATFEQSPDPWDTPEELVGNWELIGSANRPFNADISGGLHASTRPVQIGARGGLDVWAGKTFRSVFYEDGVKKWDMNPAKITGPGQTSFVSDTGEEWVLAGDATLEHVEGMDAGGVIVCEFAVDDLLSSTYRYAFQIDDGSFDHRILLAAVTNGAIQLGATANPDAYSSTNGPSDVVPGQVHKAAIKFDGNEIAMSVDGATVSRVLQTTEPWRWNTFRLGHTFGDQQFLSGGLKSIALAPDATVSDEDLQEFAT